MKARGFPSGWARGLWVLGAFLLIAGGKVAFSAEQLEGELAVSVAPFDAAAPTFRADILPVFQARCAHCHGPTRMRHEDFTNYQTVVSMKEQIYDTVVVKKNMPIGMRLPPDAVNMIATWIQNGMPEGEAPANPAPLAELE